MLCSRCGKNQATVYYKQILNNKVTELHLCAQCAKASGLESTPAGSPVFDLLASLGGLREAPEKRLQRLQCPGCGLRYMEFRESGYVGCPTCYESFSEPLKDILKHIHGALRHSGKSPPAASAQMDRRRNTEETARVRKDLESAIREERFEDAARLRDRLHGLGG